MKVIKARKFRINDMERKVKGQITKAANSARESFEETTKRFDQVAPVFTVSSSKGGLVKLVRPKKNRSGQIWTYVDLGTKVRRAIMSDDFRPKTRPDTFRTTRGQGGLVVVGDDIIKPGIKARRWTTLAAETYGKKLVAGVVGIIKDF